MTSTYVQNWWLYCRNEVGSINHPNRGWMLVTAMVTSEAVVSPHWYSQRLESQQFHGNSPIIVPSRSLSLHWIYNIPRIS